MVALKRGVRRGLSLNLEDQFIVLHNATGAIATIRPVPKSKLEETLQGLEHLGDLQIFKLDLAVKDIPTKGDKDIIRIIGRKESHERTKNGNES